MPDARYPGAELLCAAAAHRVPAANGQDLSPLEPAHLHLHEHLGKSAYKLFCIRFVILSDDSALSALYRLSYLSLRYVICIEIKSGLKIAQPSLITQQRQGGGEREAIFGPYFLDTKETSKV